MLLQLLATPDVGYGSWLCENTLARHRDSINVSQRTLLGARSVASRSYFGALRKILLAACQIFAFLHSQGHSRLRWSRPRLVHVRFTSECVAKLSLRLRLKRDSVDQDMIRGSGR